MLRARKGEKKKTSPLFTEEMILHIGKHSLTNNLQCIIEFYK
jgi:hypothetical protein